MAGFAAALLLLGQLLLPAFAFAHNIGPNYDTVVRSVTPATDGLDVRAIPSEGDLQVTNHSNKDVLIDGYDSEPYVWMRAGGRVFVNNNSPAKYLNLDQYAQVTVPKFATPKAKPRWKQVATDGTYKWHDHRIHWMSPEPPRSVRDATSRMKIFDWKVPIAVAGKRGAITGTLYWAGTPKAPPIGSIIVFAVSGLTVVIGGAIWIRRTRENEDSDDEQPKERKEAW